MTHAGPGCSPPPIIVVLSSGVWYITLQMADKLKKENRLRVRRIERPKSLAETVLVHLRFSIIHGDLELGQPLSERQLADDLGVSKTPVREALAQLRNEGLVLIYPQRGAFVFTLSAREVAEICEFRSAVETAALELAIARNPDGFVADLGRIVSDMAAAHRRGDQRSYLSLDTRYHASFFDHCGNNYLRESYERYVGKIAALRTHLAIKPLHTKLSFQEHQAMLETIRNRDVQGTKVILAIHIGRTRQTYSAGIEDIAAADKEITEAS
jgi:DNA-binding GntR family transcriptional regulator